MNDIPQIAAEDILDGHTSAETAFVIDDYPYGFRLRCQRRVWVEQATKGTYKGFYRFVSQTTNPKKQGTVWNKPHAGTYFPFVVLFRDQTDEGHIKPMQLHVTDEPANFLAILRICHVLSDQMQKRFDVMLASAKLAEYRWEPWMEQLNTMLAEQASRSSVEVTEE